ncbi:MAG: hypothetical protein LBG23_01595 [Endomicrobium sp.]|jgi:hypothetical protein|nr:hypothetical protein [Endomicrobium sp.]
MSKALMAKHASIKSRKYGTFPPVIKNKDEYISLGLSLDSIVEIKKYEYKMHNIKINYYPDTTDALGHIKGNSSLYF